MSKKKTSSKDFLNLLDEQEVIKDRIAFEPPKKKRKTKATKKTYTIRGIELGVLQSEWVNFAINNTPQFVKDAITSKPAQEILTRVIEVGERVSQAVPTPLKRLTSLIPFFRGNTPKSRHKH